MVPTGGVRNCNLADNGKFDSHGPCINRMRRYKERSGFSGFPLRPTKWQSSLYPVHGPVIRKLCEKNASGRSDLAKRPLRHLVSAGAVGPVVTVIAACPVIRHVAADPAALALRRPPVVPAALTTNALITPVVGTIIAARPVVRHVAARTPAFAPVRPPIPIAPFAANAVTGVNAVIVVLSKLYAQIYVCRRRIQRRGRYGCSCRDASKCRKHDHPGKIPNSERHRRLEHTRSPFPPSARVR